MKKLIDLLRGTAPTVAQVLATAGTGNPAVGLLAKQMIAKIGSRVADNPDAREADLYPVLENPSPETLEALRKIDADLQVEMRRLDIRLEEIGAADRGNARGLAATIQSIQVHAWLTVFALGLWLYFMFVFFDRFTEASAVATLTPLTAAVIGRMLGTLDGILIQSFAFWFGTTRGSQDKHEDLMQNLRR